VIITSTLSSAITLFVFGYGFPNVPTTPFLEKNGQLIFNFETCIPMRSEAYYTLSFRFEETVLEHQKSLWEKERLFDPLDKRDHQDSILHFYFPPYYVNEFKNVQLELLRI